VFVVWGGEIPPPPTTPMRESSKDLRTYALHPKNQGIAMMVEALIVPTIIRLRQSWICFWKNLIVTNVLNSIPYCNHSFDKRPDLSWSEAAAIFIGLPWFKNFTAQRITSQVAVLSNNS
ncbi:hypothetical protein ACQ4M4_13260, partial [Leptolyngbya sp. AN02str]|uniref:hypothetical protein n=1 Tax=Leptolyngbya sp. AN02str TaxID=3423363 RepID=UPI003D317EF3